MGKTVVFVCVAIFVMAYVETSLALGGCPPPSKIYNYPKKESCRSNGDCKNGMICCMNPAHVKSCTYPDPHSHSGGSAGPNAVYCEGVKCQPFEVCKPDPARKGRKKCQRP